jgi:FPC/CPF motif-containing protein YcgG
LDGKLIQLAPQRSDPSPEAFHVHAQFTAMLQSPSWPCVMGRQSIVDGRYAFSILDELGDAHAARATRRSILDFNEHFPPSGPTPRFASFIAVFRAPVCPAEDAFEHLLWRHLQLMHDCDDRPWDPEVSSDAADPHFSFSIGGRAFYVIGMHSAASRYARRFAYPALVFNPHDQFEALRRANVFERIRDVVRRTDQALQGEANPMLADHGLISEARQYSGRQVGADWRCPFLARAPNTPRLPS